MKLIIEIPRKNLIKDDFINFFGCYNKKLDEVIKNGIPLDKIRAEIEELRYGQPFRKFVVDECLEIIDKYREGEKE